MSGSGRIVIVGAGHAGVQAAASLRDEGFAGPIALVSADGHAPYQRPPLSKAYMKGEATADVTVAEALSEPNLDALKVALKSVTGKDVALNVKIDPSIIGGLVVKLGSRMVDSSLRTKLNSIKHAMKEAG